MLRNIKLLALSAILSAGILTATAETNVSTGDWDDNWGGSTPGFGVSFVANPTADFADLRLSLSSPDPDAAIYWTIRKGATIGDGGEWTLYSAPIEFTGDATISYYASRGTGENSEMQQFTLVYADYQADAPEIRFTADKTGIEILSDVAGAEIRFTTDGTDPTEASEAYYTAIDLEEGAHTVKARVFAPGMFASAVARFDYTHNPESGEGPVNALDDINADPAGAIAFATEGGVAGLTATTPATVGIYNLSGACVATLDLTPGFNPLPSLEHGLYVVAGLKIVL